MGLCVSVLLYLYPPTAVVLRNPHCLHILTRLGFTEQIPTTQVLNGFVYSETKFCFLFIVNLVIPD